MQTKIRKEILLMQIYYTKFIPDIEGVKCKKAVYSREYMSC